MALLTPQAKHFLVERRRLEGLDREPTAEELAALDRTWTTLDTTQRKRVLRRLAIRRTLRTIGRWFGKTAATVAEEELRRRLP